MKLTPEQVKVAQAFIQEAKRQGATHKQTKALLEAGLVESNLKNLKYGDRDSIGSLQQRNSWGSTKSRLDPTQSARKFLKGAKGAKGGTSGELAQAVQRSAFPGRYDQQGKQAAALLQQLGGSGGGGGVAARAPSPGIDPAALAAYAQNSHDPNALLMLAAARRSSEATQPAPKSTGAHGVGNALAKGSNKPLELAYRNKTFKDGKAVTPFPDHYDHVHDAEASKKVLKRHMKLATDMGLTITSTTGGKHAKNSYHYQGKAIDVAGNPKVMQQWFDLIAAGK